MTLNLVQVIKAFLSDVKVFSRVVVRRPLRAYQLEPARAIVASVLGRKGLTFAVVMARQAGKNELSAQLEAYLMNLYQQVRGAQLVKASPTYKPQTVNSKLRLRDCLDNAWNKGEVRGDEGYIVRLGRCRAFFFSAHPGANVVGATASVLLECDEAQDVDEEKWNKEFVPMGASTNVTTVFYGTIWTSRTLLARVMRQLREQEATDGIKRVFLVPWEQVAAEVPSYGEHVGKEIARLGRQHPIVKTQYCLEEIDEAGRLFPAERQARMQGDHPRQRRPIRTEIYALLVDVAGEDEELEGAELREANRRKDSTVVTVVRVAVSSRRGGSRGPNGDLGPVALPEKRQDAKYAEGGGLPRYEVVDRHWWTGKAQTEVYRELLSLFAHWRASYIVVDATGVGAGLSSFLRRRLGLWKDDPPGAVYPFEFTGVSKSDLGWEFLGVVDSGRFKDYAWGAGGPGQGTSGVQDQSEDTREHWRQVSACEFEVMPGPGKLMRWGVVDPDHDDFVISAALCSCLDRLEWRVPVDGRVIPPARKED